MSENQTDNGNESTELTEEQIKTFDESIEKIIEDDGVTREVALETHSKRLFGQKNHFQEKATDPETGKSYKEILKEKLEDKKETDTDNKQTPKKPVAKDDKDDSERISNLETSEEKRTFGHQNNLTPEEQDIVFSYAKGTGTTPAEALESSFVKNGLEALRKEKANSNATPNPSSRASKVGDKNFHEMDNKDQKKNYGQLVKQITKK